MSPQGTRWLIVLTLFPQTRLRQYFTSDIFGLGKLEALTVNVQISLSGDTSTTYLESLSDWLKDEPKFTGRVRLVGPTPQEGELGAATNAVLVMLGSGGALSVLASSLKTWLSQPRKSDVRIRIERGDGKSIEIDAKRVDDVNIEALLNQTLRDEG